MFNIKLVLEDGSKYYGYSFGSKISVSGEVVFNTGMVGYPESLTDPSYKGQILALTYPLIGNYGISNSKFESDRIQVSGLIVLDYSNEYSHWSAVKSLGQWLKENNVPGICGIDTRALTKKLREKGTMLGKIVFNNEEIEFDDPNKRNLVKEVSIKEKKVYGNGKKTVILVDCGTKNSILESLLRKGFRVIRVPWDYNFLKEDFDGVFISNGPGDPKMCVETIENVRKAIEEKIPVMGVCLGNQILALAAGADTYKLKYGHRSQNQPCIKVGTNKAYITSQNHGYAVNGKTLPKSWQPWFVNLNDKTIEGIRHKKLPFMSVQFHPEANPGSLDTMHIFDKFMKILK